MKQRIILSKDIENEIAEAISECRHDRLFVLTDEHTREACWPRLRDFLSLKDATLITIKAGDTHKDIASVSDVCAACKREEPRDTRASSTSEEAW